MVRLRTARRNGAGEEGNRTAPRSVGAGPGLLLDYEIALDGEDATALAEIEQLDQLGIDVELVTVFAQATRDAEAQTLASIR